MASRNGVSQKVANTDIRQCSMSADLVRLYRRHNISLRSPLSVIHRWSVGAAAEATDKRTQSCKKNVNNVTTRSTFICASQKIIVTSLGNLMF